RRRRRAYWCRSVISPCGN
ncbi:phage tail fiber repeat protein, partial [Haemophilus influenzae]